MPTASIGIYVRVSRKGDREDDRFRSPKEQADRASALAQAKGYAVGPTFEDIDVSGATAPSDRPAMAELLAAIDRGELAGIAAYSLDRLSREPAHGNALVKRVTKAGGVILTPDIPDAIDTPTGEFTFGMLLQVAKLYRSQAKARWASATEGAILAGIPVGRTNLGYRQRSDRRIEVDPATAPLVRELYEKRAAGAGWYVVTDLLTERTGRRWTISGARELIRNPIYKTGRLTYGDVVSEWDAGTIVDEALWHAAQRREGEPSPRPSRSEGRYLLSGLARCATCGYALNPRPGNTKYRSSRHYKCRNRTCTARARVKADTIERYVVLQSFAVGDELERREAAPDLTELQAAVDQAALRLEWVTTPEAVDALGPGFAATARQYREAHDEALAALGAARTAAGYSDVALRLRDVWDDLSPGDRRDALALFWKEIRVEPKVDGKQAITLVPRGPGAEAELALPEKSGSHA